jgi:NAD(P)-dependent dehydrogenase (short-subunit alcohol dehydrogenase family)
MPEKVVLITGASSGFGRLTAEALARAGHTVYASMRDVAGRNARNAAEMRERSARDGVDLRPVELDVQSEPSALGAVKEILANEGRIDVLVHNAGHMMFGPAEAFTPEQFAQQYDVNVLGTQRVNRAVLPHMRAAGQGLLVWVSSSSSAGGTPPYLSPLLRGQGRHGRAGGAVRARAEPLGHRDVDHRAGRVHQGHQPLRQRGPAGRRGARRRVRGGPVPRLRRAGAGGVRRDRARRRDVAGVAEAIVQVVDMPFGRRPFRVHYDPTQDGADVGFAVLDRLRAEMLHRVGLSDLLRPAAGAAGRRGRALSASGRR